MSQSFFFADSHCWSHIQFQSNANTLEIFFEQIHLVKGPEFQDYCLMFCANKPSAGQFHNF